MRTIATIDNLDIRISASFNQAAAAIQRLNSQLDSTTARLRNVGREINTPIRQLNSQLNSASARLRNVGTTINAAFSGATESGRKLEKSISTISKINTPVKALTNELKRTAAQFLTIRAAFRGIQKSIQNSMNYIETLNYFERAFEQVASKADLSAFSEMGYESAERYFDSFSERARQLASKMSGFNINADGTLTASGMPSLGLDPNKLMNYQAMFGQMSSSMGIASETSLKLSQALTEIGADLASVKNMKFEKVWEDMASGLAGMSRTLDKYGVNIRSVNLQQKLNELGIKANISALNQNDKALLRGIILLDSTRYAWGDLANTLNQPANMLRLIEGNIQNLSRTIGNLFLPVIAKVLPYINGFIIALQRLFTWIGKIFKIDLSNLMPKGGGGGSGTISDLIGDTGELEDGLNAATAAAKKLNKQVRAFDELNVINTSSGAGSAGVGGIGSGLLDEAFDKAFEEYQKAWDEAFANVEDKTQKIADKIQAFFKDLFKPVATAWSSEGDFVINGWKHAFEGIDGLVKDIGRDIATMWQQQGTVDIFRDIFHVIGDIGLVAGNLAGKFREAWNTNNVGLHIFENIRDILAVIIDNIRIAADYTVEWSKTLDFYPLLSKMEEWTKSLVPVFDSLSGVITDFYTQVLLPLAKWTLEKGIPDLLQVFIDFNSKVDWEALRTNLSEFWQHLEPFAETVGEGLVIFIERISDAIANFLNSETFVNFLHDIENWMDNVTPEDAANGIEKLVKALLAFKVAVIGINALKGVSAIINAISTAIGKLISIGSALFTFGRNIVGVFELMSNAGMTLHSAMTTIFGGLGTTLAGVFSVVSGIVLAVKNFVTMLTDGFSWLNEILMVVGTALAAIGAVILGAPALVAGIVAAVVAAVGTIVVVIHDNWDAICEWFSGVADWINTNVIQPVIGFFQGVWTSVSGFFANLWNDITGIWSTASGWFNSSVVEPIVSFFQGLSLRVQQIFEGLWIIIQAVWIIVSQWFNENVIIPVVGFFQGLWEAVSGFFVSLWEDIVAIWTSVSEWFNENVTSPVTDFFKGVWENVSSFFSNLWEDIQTIWGVVAGWFNENIITPVQNAFEIACDAIGGFFSSLWDGIKKGVVGAMNAVLGGIESAINFIVNGINSIIGGFNKIVSWAAKVAEVDWGGVDSIPKVSLPRVALATGGIVYEATFAEIGEAGKEGVLPLTNRAAMSQLVNEIMTSAGGGQYGNGYDDNSEELSLLMSQNQLLRQILTAIQEGKTITIGEEEIGRASMRYIQGEERRLQKSLVGTY